MGLPDKFLVDTANFQAILETLQAADYLPDRIDRQYLKEIGYAGTSDALVPGVLKELNLLDEQGAPTDLLQTFKEQKPSKEAFAYGIIRAYADLFQDHPSIHNLSKREVVDIFNEYLEGEKSHIVIEYMANTFRTLVEYVESSQIEEILAQEKLIRLEQDFPSEKEALDDDTQPNHSKKEELAEESSDVVAFNDNHLAKKMDRGPIPKFSDLEKDISEDAPQPTLVDRAYIKRAALLFKLGRHRQALSAMEQVYQRFANSDNTQLYHQASATLVKKMELMEKLGIQDNLLSTYEQVIGRLGHTEQTGFVRQVDRAYIRRAEILLETDQHQQAIEALDEAITRFKRTGRNPANLAEMMYNRAEVLEKLGRDEEALEAYEDLILAFKDN